MTHDGLLSPQLRRSPTTLHEIDLEDHWHMDSITHRNSVGHHFQFWPTLVRRGLVLAALMVLQSLRYDRHFVVCTHNVCVCVFNDVPTVINRREIENNCVGTMTAMLKYKCMRE